MTAPCKDCPERHELCHMECERYKTFRAKKDDVNRRMQEDKRLLFSRPGEKDRELWREMYKKKVHGNK